MGRRNKAYSKDLHQQAYERFKAMHAFGESKKAAVAEGTERDKIFSYNTYKSYWKHTKYFIKYIKENHPECTTLKSARKYVNEWLQARVDQGLSAWTVQLEANSMASSRTTRIISSLRRETGRISSEAAATGCATGTSPKPTTMS